jgi:hypothetical protein
VNCQKNALKAPTCRLKEYPNSASIRRIRRDRFLRRLRASVSRCVVSSMTVSHEGRFMTMRCPYCKNSQTEVFRTKCLRSKTYRHRRCQFCKAKFRTQEKPVRWEGVDRRWPGTAPSRKSWGSHRVPALRGYCEVESCGANFKQTGARRHVDHIVPARLIRRLRAGNPDLRENLQCICDTCHGCKLQADHKLCMGDRLGYLEILRVNHFDVARAERVLTLYGI